MNDTPPPAFYEPPSPTPQQEADEIRLGELRETSARAFADYRCHLDVCRDCDDGCAEGRELEQWLGITRAAVKQFREQIDNRRPSYELGERFVQDN